LNKNEKVKIEGIDAAIFGSFSGIASQVFTTPVI
jgi:hypothetical protein